jgi:hypothetical protein
MQSYLLAQTRRPTVIPARRLDSVALKFICFGLLECIMLGAAEFQR